jgi:hypothetical protein
MESQAVYDKTCFCCAAGFTIVDTLAWGALVSHCQRALSMACTTCDTEYIAVVRTLQKHPYFIGRMSLACRSVVHISMVL